LFCCAGKVELLGNGDDVAEKTEFDARIHSRPSACFLAVGGRHILLLLYYKKIS
jgi:hypothetical protein